MDEKHKRLVTKAGSMKEIHKLSLKHPDMKEAAVDSIASAKVLLSQVFFPGCS